jgi:hypothetical protein
VSRDTDKSSHFLNVDLDVYSRSNLELLVAALGKRVFVLFVGRHKRTYEAHLEVAADAKTADAVIKKFVVLISSLPRAARMLWDTAKSRDFSIEVQAGIQPTVLDIALDPETVRAAASLNARIVITVYAPRKK